MGVELTKIEREYQDAAMGFASYGNNMHYPCYGLVEEAGELADAVDKANYNQAVGELSDIMWMVAAICKELDVSWNDVVFSANDNGPILLEDPGIENPTGSGKSVIRAASALLTSEVSKVAGKIAKFIRKNNGVNPKCALGFAATEKAANVFNKDMLERLITIVRIVMLIAKALGYTLPLILTYNIDKLTERKATGTIVGSGETVAERLANAKKEVC